ncbi:MAG: hypothetical protein H8D67_27665 [Deltaproteobacteria bacterium]|nr:hypothetical protein [Deltaproteobacteria bacterium]
MSQPENNMKANSLSNSAEEHILVADVNRIKEYLFASVRLRHIINASAMLAYVNETLTEELVKEKGGEIIFTAGGVTEAAFSSKCKAVECAEELEGLYPLHTRNATAAVHVETRKTGEDFVTAIRRATRKIRLKKDATVFLEENKDQKVPPQPEFEPVSFFSGSPFFRICQQTGLAYATFWEKPHEQTEEDEEEEYINPEAFSAGSWKQKEWEPPKCLKVKLPKYACTNEHPAGEPMELNSKRGDRLAIDVLLRYRLAHELNLKPDDFDYPFDFEKLVALLHQGTISVLWTPTATALVTFLQNLRKARMGKSQINKTIKHYLNCCLKPPGKPLSKRR